MIRIEHLNFLYPDTNKVILSDINLTFHQNQFTVILGPNGSGKTTLVKLIARLLKPNSGKLFLKNQPFELIRANDFYRMISYVPQKFFSIYPYTVFEIVLMGRSLHFNFLGLEKKDDIQKVNEVLKQLGLEHLAKKRITEISGGELQKVILARSIVQDSEILLLDEPNTHLDLKHQIQIFELLKNLQLQGKTIIAVSHDINLASFYADRLIFLKDGIIKYDGDINSVLKEEIIEDVFEIENKVVFDPVGNFPQLIIKPFRKRN
ncbi:MAG: ABC transporter ATP-binding protein [Ignavibacteria bacterium]|jgi:iron complex transport system ATP-binding protein|nr:ABC transporter ATP-binding protein [Ignavibacteria bacterium]MDH7527207.1 ABC transporter ATP-binding protein [Ignavibacteria bacterium]